MKLCWKYENDILEKRFFFETFFVDCCLTWETGLLTAKLFWGTVFGGAMFWGKKSARKISWKEKRIGLTLVILIVSNDKVYPCKQSVRTLSIFELHSVLHSTKKNRMYALHFDFDFCTLFFNFFYIYVHINIRQLCRLLKVFVNIFCLIKPGQYFCRKKQIFINTCFLNVRCSSSEIKTFF